MGLGTCVWGMWEGWDALTFFGGSEAVVHRMWECGRAAHGNCGVQKGWAGDNLVHMA